MDRKKGEGGGKAGRLPLSDRGNAGDLRSAAGDCGRRGAWQALFGLRTQCRCALLRPPAVADSCPACAGQSCQRKRFPEPFIGSSYLGFMNLNRFRWSFGKSRCSAHVAICCHSPLVHPPKLKVSGRGKGVRGKGDNPFSKGCPLSPASLFSLPLLPFTLSFKGGIRYGGGEWNGIMELLGVRNVAFESFD